MRDPCCLVIVSVKKFAMNLVMASILPNKRRSRLITPANSSFSNCVQDHLFIQPLRGPLDNFKPIVYLDEQGRRHGRVSDHLLQRQIEADREKLKKPAPKKILPSSTLYGIRNPNIAALVKGVSAGSKDDEQDEDDEKVQADEEVKYIEYKKSSKGGTAKSGNRQISSISGKQSVKFDTTPSVNMARLVDSHLTELDDMDDDDENSESDDDEELDSIKPISDPDSSDLPQTKKTPMTFSDTPSTLKDTEGGMTTNSTMDYNQPSDEMHMPPSVEDVIDEEETKSRAEKEVSSPENVVPQRKSSSNPSEKMSERPKTGSSSPARSRLASKEPTSSRASSSTASDDTSALLRSDDDRDLDSDDEQVRVKTPTVLSDPTSSTVSDPLESDQASGSLVIEKPRPVKGEYNTEKVIQLKESFQPIINEAASYGHLDIVRRLIESGQSVHTQNLLERTPLHEACVSGNGQLVAELLHSGALIDQRDSQGMTALHVAARHGTLKCVRILCENECDINAQDNLGHTAAHYSAMHNHAETLKYLIEQQHIDLSIRNQERKLAIHYAAKHGSKHVLTYFFQAKLDVSGRDAHGNTIVHEACEYGQLDSIKLIWKLKGALFQQKNQSGRTPGHTAALFGSSHVLHWLLELNLMDVDQPDKDGYTMAHLAASRGHGECFSCLTHHGAQLDQYTFDRHESVLDLGRRSGKYSRIEQALSGTLQCGSCKEKFAKEKYDRAHARNPVEQLIHTQIQRGYHLNLPVNRSSTHLSQRNRSTMS